jgi:hypothetical protein
MEPTEVHPELACHVKYTDLSIAVAISNTRPS